MREEKVFKHSFKSKELGDKMVLDSDTLSQLRRYFGLNLYEVKIWTALLSRGISTAGELSEISGVPRSRAYDILESLERKGFAVMKVGKPIKYIAIPPEEVIERAKKYMETEHRERVKRLESVKDSELMSTLKQLYEQGVKVLKPTEYSGMIRGRNNLLNHLGFMIRNAKQEVVLVTNEKALFEKVEALEKVLEGAKKRGVKIRIAAPVGKEARELVERLKKFAEFKPLKEDIGRFCVVDGSNVLVMLESYEKIHPNFDTGIWMSSEPVGKSLRKAFEKL
ncbi:hypothetical protein DRN62_00820 [Nanoarchaeota archaeon]|nr:MAG: hypothetical protein DRN62_00820 [Nanoarchaeota archaeon]